MSKKKLISMYVKQSDYESIKLNAASKHMTTGELMRKLMSIYVQNLKK